jgi:ADP-ribose pyrophosphatase
MVLKFKKIIMSNQKYKKIPDNAKLVFKGVMHDVYQWEQQLFDGTFTTFECLKRKDNVDIVATTEDGKVIINFEEQPNRKPKICFPCGGSDEGESLLNAAKREFLEETGYTTSGENWSEWINVDILKYGKMEWNVQYFVAKNCKKTHEPHVDGGEKIEVKLFSFEEFLEISQKDNFSQKEIKIELKKILEIRNEFEKKEKLEQFRKFIFGEVKNWEI